MRLKWLDTTTMARQSRKKLEQPVAIAVTEAVRRATAFLTQVFTGEPFRDVRLEEIEFLDDENCWSVTLSFLRPIPKEEMAVWERETEHLAGKGYRREYKSVEVDVRTGEARAIKMRPRV